MTLALMRSPIRVCDAYNKKIKPTACVFESNTVSHTRPDVSSGDDSFQIVGSVWLDNPAHSVRSIRLYGALMGARRAAVHCRSVSAHMKCTSSHPAALSVRPATATRTAGYAAALSRAWSQATTKMTAIHAHAHDIITKMIAVGGRVLYKYHACMLI